MAETNSERSQDTVEFAFKQQARTAGIELDRLDEWAKKSGKELLKPKELEIIRQTQELLRRLYYST